MKYFPRGQKLTTDNLLEAVRRGQVFGFKLECITITEVQWRIYAEVVQEGFGLSSIALEHRGSLSHPTEAIANQVLIDALKAGEYRQHLHIGDGITTLCRRPHKGGKGDIPKVASPRDFEHDPRRCSRCWVIWNARGQAQESREP